MGPLVTAGAGSSGPSAAENGGLLSPVCTRPPLRSQDGEIWAKARFDLGQCAEFKGVADWGIGGRSHV